MSAPIQSWPIQSWPIQSWIVETLVATTILMLIVLAIRGIVAARFGTRAAYLLWLAPALRMIMPPLPQHWFNIDGFATQGQVLKDAAFVVTDVSSPPAMAAAASGGNVDWLMLLGVFWLGGAALFFARHLLAYSRFSKRVFASARHSDASNRINFAASPAITSPIALGIFARAIIVPEDFETRFDATEQRLALAHEMTHHQRGDLPVNLAALVMLALHWFNPVAHIAHRAFRLDQESACDAIVLRGASISERHSYGSALFKAAIGPVPIAICAMGTATTLKTRLSHIIARAETPERAITGAALALAVIGGGLALTASTSFASDTKLSAARDSKQTVQDGANQVSRDAKEARDEARQAKIEAEQALIEAEQEAQSAIREAEADVRATQEEARAAVGDSKERMAQAQERVREAQIEADRAIAEAKRELAEARRDMVEPPAPPAPPAAPDAPEAPAAPSALLSFGASPDAAPALQAKAAEVECPKQARRRQISSRNDGDNQIVVIICDDRISTFTNATTRAAMNNARAQIMAMKVLGEGQRAAALKSLDEALAKIRSRGFTLQ
jgi:bla regulator protein blaR1